MTFKVIIPARYESTRLPGKPLLDIAGKPMIQRVFEAACKSSAADVVIATDDERIIEACMSFGAQVCLTSKEHLSGTDRLQEVVQQLNFSNDDIIVNVQGDEPLIAPELIDQVADNLATNSWASIASLCEPFRDPSSVLNPNNVKVVFNRKSEALYFSRAPIPWDRDSISVEDIVNVEESQQQQLLFKLSKSFNSSNYYRHIGIYAYRTEFLNSFVTWPTAPMELVESLEQLRALENGHRIHMSVACKAVAPGVDTPEDLEQVRQMFKKD